MAENDHPTLTYTKVPERGKEQQILIQNILSFKKSGKGKVIYISGVPGSGKTHTVMSTCKEIKEADDSEGAGRAFYFNCGLLKSKKMFFRELYKTISMNENTMNKEKLARIMPAKRGRKPLRNKRGTRLANNTNFVNTLFAALAGHIVVLDEIDFLPQAYIYTLFEQKAGILIIAISNTLAVNNRLMSRIDLQMVFEAYGSEELKSIGMKNIMSGLNDSGVNEGENENGNNKDSEVNKENKIKKKKSVKNDKTVNKEGKVNIEVDNANRKVNKTGSDVVKKVKAFEIVCRRVAAISGDARRILRYVKDNKGCILKDSINDFQSCSINDDVPVYKYFLNEMNEDMLSVLKGTESNSMDYFECEKIKEELRKMGMIKKGRRVLTSEELENK